MHEIHTLAFTLYKVFLTVAQLEEVTRREFIDTTADGLVGLQSRLECLFLTRDAYVPLLFLSPLKQGECMALFTPWGIRITVAT